MQTMRACGNWKSSGRRARVIEDETAGGNLRRKLAERDLIHGDEDVGMRNERRTDALLREADVTMGAAGAHLGAVGGQPADFQAFAHAHFGEQLAEQEHALSAEAGDLDFEGVEMVLVRMGLKLAKAARLGSPGFPTPMWRSIWVPMRASPISRVSGTV